jgi:ParB/RepB/Spo0J family partition protein
LVSPNDIEKNPENPRLIFREQELRELQDSIQTQGILVPLTVYQAGKRLVILDGERRWRCAHSLGLAKIPVIVQPEPDKMTNIMMMFAIHNQRRDWDPLPTAFKLQQLEQLYEAQLGHLPNETQLAQLASMDRGQVRRLKAMLALPERYLSELMVEAEKPRSAQTLTVDQVLEATRGAQALRKRDVIDDVTEDALSDAIVAKYRSGVVKNTVEPRQLARIARAVDRGELTPRAAAKVASRLIREPSYSIARAFDDSVARIDYEHTLEQQAVRLTETLALEGSAGAGLGDDLLDALRELRDVINQLVD